MSNRNNVNDSEREIFYENVREERDTEIDTEIVWVDTFNDVGDRSAPSGPGLGFDSPLQVGEAIRLEANWTVKHSSSNMLIHFNTFHTFSHYIYLCAVRCMHCICCISHSVWIADSFCLAHFAGTLCQQAHLSGRSLLRLKDLWRISPQ